MEITLADTCIFIDFFRGAGPYRERFRSLVEKNQLALSQIVRLELLFGAKAREHQALESMLDGLIPVRLSPSSLSVAEKLLPLARKHGLNCGVADYLIAIQALENNTRLMTSDKVLARLARGIGVDVV